MSVARVATVCGILLAVCGEAFAVPSQSPALERDVETVIASVLRGWHRADASAIAAQYEPGGDFISPTGQHATGRRAIEAFYKGAFEAGYAGSGATASILHMRGLSGTLVLVDGSWAITPTSAAKITKSESGLFVAVLHRHAGRWWIVALREQSGAQSLQEL